MVTFNANKSEAFAFCRKEANSLDYVVKHGDDDVVLSNAIVYLRKPIGLSMVFTHSLQISHFGEKARKVYGILFPTKLYIYMYIYN